MHKEQSVKTCYKCQRRLRYAAYPLETVWFCGDCWYKLNDTLKIMYANEVKLVDVDLERKERQLNRLKAQEYLYDDSDFHTW